MMLRPDFRDEIRQRRRRRRQMKSPVFGIEGHTARYAAGSRQQGFRRAELR